MKITMVSRAPVGSYTSKLVKGFSIGCPNDDVMVYGPRGEARNENYIRLVGMWTPGLYPFQIFRQLVRCKPDIVHVQHEFGMFGNPIALSLTPILYMLLKFLRVRVVTTLHSLVFPDSLSKDSIGELLPSASWVPRVFVEFGLHIVYRSACELSDTIIVHQQSHKKKLEKYYRISPTKISFIPHGVGPTEYSADNESLSAWRSKFGSKRLMLYLGYISPRKGIEYLIDAFATFSNKRPEWALVLAGGLSKNYYEPYRRRIANIIDNRNLATKIVMTGFIPEADADALFRLCDLVVLPYTQVVGNASACNLAMGYGKPIIASNLSPFPEELEDFRHGILCPPRDSDRLRDAMERLCSDQSLYEDISHNLKRLGKLRDWQRVAVDIDRLYAMMLNKASHRETSSTF